MSMELHAEIATEVRGRVGFITLNRPKALNALSLPMVRALTTHLLTWREDPEVQALAIRGSDKTGPFGAFCAGGDIRFFHQAALAGDPDLGAFFTEEYALNHLIHTYPKTYLAFLDGIVMGGGMGLSQGAQMRIVTERTRMAMPETQIGLFPDVGGGYFLSRCPGRVGEYLALTGEPMGAAQAIAYGLADVELQAVQLPQLWRNLGAQDFSDHAQVARWIDTTLVANNVYSAGDTSQIDAYFSLPTLPLIVQALDVASGEWERHTATTLRKRSPLMLHVALEQIRRARSMTLADDLRMERDMVHHCFPPRQLERSGAASETVEGIRALAVDKDHLPKWNPPRIEDVTPTMVASFFVSPWPADAHPLRGLN